MIEKTCPNTLPEPKKPAKAAVSEPFRPTTPQINPDFSAAC
jgi:hypothetical protein